MKALLCVLVSATVVAQSIRAAEVRITPVEISQFDLGKMEGAFVGQLGWSPERTELYLQTMTEDQRALPKSYYHYVMTVGPGGVFKKVTAAPDWAVAYWTWKSDKNAPDDPTFKIEVGIEKRIAPVTAIPMGGDLAKGGSEAGSGNGASADSVIAASRASTNGTVYSMHLKGEIVGEWVDHRIMPGVTFGWGPKGTHLIAYAEKSSGRLVIMDSTGAKQKVDGTKSVVLPAWSDDGQKLAYLEGRGRNKYAVIVAGVLK